jgi:hypothetical protein
MICWNGFFNVSSSVSSESEEEYSLVVGAVSAVGSSSELNLSFWLALDGSLSVTDAAVGVVVVVDAVVFDLLFEFSWWESLRSNVLFASASASATAVAKVFVVMAASCGGDFGFFLLLISLQPLSTR